MPFPFTIFIIKLKTVERWRDNIVMVTPERNGRKKSPVFNIISRHSSGRTNK
jgi:hypothetical protein